ncbi:hypothetical protein FN976_23725 [Caenimonas sedimenti]|uniref:Uncharacterized protein n=1 Tax=Caenimonas sedimenti TaxID=2596921 RepID=A0A562ZIH0_9BURK|nr:hypothetical protein [Caenimonas sedimenti]TWO68283.1 hypothetical protein FN976_23725 [Caenimonas sedimenti]
MNSAFDDKSRLVRNLLALRMLLAMDQMQTGKWADHIEDIDTTLAGLGHDMKSTAACAADSVRRSMLLPHLVSGRTRARRRPSARAVPRE